MANRIPGPFIPEVGEEYCAAYFCTDDLCWKVMKTRYVQGWEGDEYYVGNGFAYKTHAEAASAENIQNYIKFLAKQSTERCEDDE